MIRDKTNQIGIFESHLPQMNWPFGIMPQRRAKKVRLSNFYVRTRIWSNFS